MPKVSFGSRWAQMPLAGKVKFVGFWFGLGLTAFAAVRSCTDYEDGPFPGGESFIYVKSNPTLPIIVTKSKDAASAMLKAVADVDTTGVDRLQSTGHAWIEDPGTKVLPVESSFSGLLEVRLLSGSNLGTIVWLPLAWVHTRPFRNSRATGIESILNAN